MCFKKYFFAFCFISFISSCENHVPIIFSDSNITTKNNTTAEVNIPVTNGNTEAAILINTVINNTVISSLQIGDTERTTSKTIEESITAFNKEYKNFSTDFPESSQHWEAQIDGEVIYQSSSIISIALTSYINTGGAHGNLNIYFKNFNPSTGKSISNNNLFKNIDAFKKMAQPYFEKAIKGKEGVFESNNFELPANIAYNDDGIILLYNTYEIAVHSVGIIEFTIPYNEVNQFLVFEGS